jgi:D-alanyl-D-alanine carboxypeptidase
MESVVATPLGWSYGLGLMKVSKACGALWGHEGDSPGYASQALNSKDGRRQVVVLTNLTGALGAAGLFGVPTRAAEATERLIQTAYCDRAGGPR